jgi:hypothetical protein
MLNAILIAACFLEPFEFSGLAAPALCRNAEHSPSVVPGDLPENSWISKAFEERQRFTGNTLTRKSACLRIIPLRDARAISV